MFLNLIDFYEFKWKILNSIKFFIGNRHTKSIVKVLQYVIKIDQSADVESLCYACLKDC